MNKLLQALFCLSSLMLAFGSCQKDETESTTRLHATIADIYTPKENGAKVVVDNTFRPQFEVGDEVWVNNTKFTAVEGESGIDLNGSSSAPYSAVYPHSAVTGFSGGTKFSDDGFSVTINLPESQTYQHTTIAGKEIQIINAPMAAYSESDNLEFKNICSLLRVRVRNNMDRGTFTISTITVTSSNRNLSGTASITKSGDAFAMEITSGSNSVKLTGLSEIVKENKSSRDYYIYIPSITGEGTQFTVKVKGTFQKQAMEYTLYHDSDNTDITVEQSTIGGFALLLNDCDITEMHPTYYFSVSADKQVYFSPGNLQWSRSGEATHSVADGGTAIGKWRFAEEQWITLLDKDESGNELSEVEILSSGKWIDLFGWGTSGWYNSTHSNKYYQPYNRQTIAAANSTNTSGFGYGPISNSYMNSLTNSDHGNCANADWGVYNAIENGGNNPGMWRTLTNDEWNYLTGSRTNASSLRTRGQINGVAGLILLPDNWSTPNGITITADASNSNANIYTIEQWRELENNGAIFLPVTGCLNATINIDSDSKSILLTQQTYGYYWSSTAKSTGSNEGQKKSFAYYFQFATVESTLQTTYDKKHVHMAIRLVQDKTE